METTRPLPRHVYVDPHILDLERRVFFEHGWYAAALDADLPRPGSWVRVWPATRSVVVARAADLGLSAVQDVCSHRGVQILDGDAGNCERLGLVCPYHGWTFELGGRRRWPKTPADPTTVDLPTLRAASRWGVVFCTDTPEPEPLATWQGALPWLDEVDPRRLRRVHHQSWEVAANWKHLVHNFQEAEHFVRVHPALERCTRAGSSWSETGQIAPDRPEQRIGAPRWLGGVMPLSPGVETVSASGKLQGRKLLVPSNVADRVRDAYVSPNLFVSLQPDYLLIYRFEPRAVDRTVVWFDVLVHAADAIDEASLRGDLLDFWDRINDEDRHICEKQQRGIARSNFQATSYAPSEDGIRAFDILWRRAMHGYIDG